GDPAAQLGPEDVSLTGARVITDLKSAEAAIDTIIEQGEGAPTHRDDSHYSRFIAVRDEYDKLSKADPHFQPAFPVVRNPVLRPPLDQHDRVYIDAPEAAHVLDLANALYGHLLRCLVQSFGRTTEEQEGKHVFIGVAIDLMFLLDAVASHLATLPARKNQTGVNAGMTFTMLRDVAKLPPGPGERRFMAERLLDMAKHADQLFPSGHPLHETSATLVSLAARIELPAGPGATDSFPRADVHPSHAGEVPPKSPDVEVETGKAVEIHFASKRCIHARFCVLGAPAVFRANTPGTWIYPDAMPVDDVVEIAHACPSGAITYVRKDGGANETAPPVNRLNLRENGPY